MIRLKQWALRVLGFLFSEGLAQRLARLLSFRLVNHLRGDATSTLLVLLLGAMDTAFCLLGSYRANIAGFRAVYIFRTDDGAVNRTIRFSDGDMRIEHAEAPNADATVDFKTAAALRNFLFSKDQDILNSLLQDDVHVHGNLNYVYRFAFLARDLERRILQVA
jgi:hypothetical protein